MANVNTHVSLSGNSPFQFDKVEPIENNNSNYRPIHGLKYVQNYKTLLRQRGVRYPGNIWT